MPTNVLGTDLRSCCSDPATGFYRDGYCRTGPDDTGLHTVCAEMTRDFLDYSVLMGNDLITSHPEWGFAGLEPGDTVLEIGAGLGSLTRHLAEIAGRVVAVELDSDLFPALQDTLREMAQERDRLWPEDD